LKSTLLVLTSVQRTQAPSSSQDIFGVAPDELLYGYLLYFSIKTFNMANQLCVRQFRMGVMIALSILQIIYPLRIDAQSGGMKVTATGTGQTTGHIAILSVTNSTGSALMINSQTCFIPSDGQYQPYITIIPEHSFPPGTTIIKLDGYCVDVHTLPVPGGDQLPPVEEWIPVGNPTVTTTETGINLLPTPAQPPFLPKDIPNLIQTPGFTTVPTDPEAEVNFTWPGTDIPVGGIIDPGNFPERFAPLLIDALQKITKAFDDSNQQGKITTPFSGDPVKEREAVIQQTFWRYTAAITGEPYRKEQFHVKVIEQFENKTGTTMETMPAEDKEKLDNGVDEFWNTFTAVGVEAKVMRK
jgi:hypothetical protein